AREAHAVERVGDRVDRAEVGRHLYPLAPRRGAVEGVWAREKSLKVTNVTESGAYSVTLVDPPSS
ncbi:MAG TPA: hypothetical protein VJU82_02665, partial [Acidobacteriaceae bacterium]|nr:hypothetical protein [Acidobacteriaceae bacterium]